MTQPTANSKIEANLNLNTQTFYCKTSFADAKGYYDDDGFVILKDSLIRKDATNSLSKWAIENREALIQKGKLILHQDRYLKLTENHLFRTPSGAAQIVLGRPSNGWLEWGNSDRRHWVTCIDDLNVKTTY